MSLATRGLLEKRANILTTFQVTKPCFFYSFSQCEVTSYPGSRVECLYVLGPILMQFQPWSFQEIWALLQKTSFGAEQRAIKGHFHCTWPGPLFLVKSISGCWLRLQVLVFQQDLLRGESYGNYKSGMFPPLLVHTVPLSYGREITKKKINLEEEKREFAVNPMRRM